MKTETEIKKEKDSFFIASTNNGYRIVNFLDKNNALFNDTVLDIIDGLVYNTDINLQKVYSGLEEGLINGNNISNTRLRNNRQLTQYIDTYISKQKKRVNARYKNIAKHTKGMGERLDSRGTRRFWKKMQREKNQTGVVTYG